MPTKDAEIIDASAPPADASPTVLVEQVPRRRMPALAVAGITLGGVVLAGLLFGGGVLVGTHLPTGGQLGMHQGFDANGFPGGPNGNGGPSPMRPGQGGPQDGSGPGGNTQDGPDGQDGDGS